MPRPRLTVALLGTALALSASVAASATAATADPALAAAAATPSTPATPSLATTGPDLAARADGIADEVVARWASIQRSDGRFPDPVAGSGEDYGTAMLGLAMVRRGVEHADRSLVSDGLDAVLAEVQRPTNGAFEPLVLADAYAWGNAKLATDPDWSSLWAPAAAQLRANLISRAPAGEASVAARCLANDACWNNLKLVGALAGQQLLATGLTSQEPGALLADPALPGRIAATVAERIPEETGSGVRRRGSAALAGGGILSDPQRDPLAYHALSTALLGRLVDALGSAAPPAARRALDRASRALLTLAAPNGDLTWWGRGQGQVWVPALAAEAAARAAVASPAGSPLRGRCLALAGAELARLRNDYGVGAFGMPLVPGAIDAATLKARSIDGYATTRGYNGLAVDALDRAAALLPAATGRATNVPATRPGATRSASQAGIATLTRGSTWVAIGGRAAAAGDARYGSGLLALQSRDASGAWTARVPGRPYSEHRVATLAIRDAGAIVPAAGTIRAQTSSTAVIITGQWSRPGGGHVVDPGTTWRWSLSPTGVLTAAFTLHHTHQVVATAIAAAADMVRRTPGGTVVTRADGTAVSYVVRVNGQIRPMLRGEHGIGGSAYDAALRAIELSVNARAGDRVTLAIRPGGAPPIAGG